MMRFLVLLITITSALMPFECQGDAGAKANYAIALTKVVDEQGVTVFRSYNGKWIGADGDWDLVFYREGKGKAVHFGITVEEFGFDYSFKDDNQVIINLADPCKDWSAITLGQEGGYFTLTLNEGPYLVSCRTGVFKDIPVNGFWPFRSIDDAGLLERYRK